MNFFDNKHALTSFYMQIGLLEKLGNDNKYLENAFNEIKLIWLNNLAQIKSVNYLMIAEAPLWGTDKKYIYNPLTKNSQFFYRSDLGYVLNKQLMNKQDFINACNEIGLLIIDISPFPFNPHDTAINYRSAIMKAKNYKQYKELVGLTVPTFFEEKIKAIGNKKADNIKVFFRYARVRNNFTGLVSSALIKRRFIKSPTEIGDISKGAVALIEQNLNN